MTYNDNLTIDGIKYRESSIPAGFNGVFALEVDPGYYAFNATNLTTMAFGNYTVIPVENTLVDIKFNVGDTTLASYNYTYIKPHKLHIAYQIVVNPCFSQCAVTPPKMTLYVNNLEYVIPSQQNGFSIYKNITLPHGQHFVKVIAESNGDWCNMMTKGDGFEAGRYLYSWTEEVEKDQPTLYVQSGLYLIMLIVMLKMDDEMLEK